MELKDILKQFKSIQPDPTYTDYSRLANSGIRTAPEAHRPERPHARL